MERPVILLPSGLNVKDEARVNGGCNRNLVYQFKRKRYFARYELPKPHKAWLWPNAKGFLFSQVHSH